MEYRIENGKVIATLDQAEVEELINGIYWADNENQELNLKVNNGLGEALFEALEEIKNGNIH